MKKILSICLLLLYITTSFGFSVQQFYCCGELSSLSIDLKQDTGKEISKNKCCNEQFNNLKGKDTHLLSVQSGNTIKHLTNLFPPNFIIFYQGHIPAILQRIYMANYTNAPSLYGIPAYIFNCTYRI